MARVSRATFVFHTLLSFVRVCVLLGEAKGRWLSEDGIRFFLPISRPDDVSSIVGARVEVCLERISRDLIGVCLRWIHVDLVFARLCSCVYRLDILDLRFSSLASVAVLLRWSYGVLARWLRDYLLEQGLLGSDDGGAKSAARLQLAPMLVVVSRWSTDLDLFFVYDILCTFLTVDE